MPPNDSGMVRSDHVASVIGEVSVAAHAFLTSASKNSAAFTVSAQNHARVTGGYISRGAPGSR